MCFVSDMKTTPRSPRSPWRRNIREPLRPRLSRKIVASARVNLNSCWSKFEEVNHTGLDLSRLVTINNKTHNIDNEINENLINELMELGNK